MPNDDKNIEKNLDKKEVPAEDKNKGTAAPEDGADQPKGYYPEGLAEHLRGKDDKETIDKLFKTVDGYRQSQAEKGVPEKPDDYAVELPEELVGKIFEVGEDGKDPFIESMKPVMHELGITNKQFNALSEALYKQVMTLQEGTEQKYVADVKFESLGGEEKAAPLRDEANVWIKALNISEKARNELELLTYHGEGLSALNELRTSLGGKKIPVNIGDSKKVGEITKETLQSRVADPRYYRDKDPAFIKETDEMFEKFYGQENAA